MTAITGYRFGGTCPACGSPLDHVNDGAVTDMATRATAVAKCTRGAGCGRTWQVVVRLVQVSAADQLPSPSVLLQGRISA